MSLRALFFIQPSGDVVLSRRFVTVEKRIKRACDRNDLSYNLHVRIPNNDEDIKLLFIKNILENKHVENTSHYPVISFKRDDGLDIWPVVVSYKLGLYMVAIPAVDSSSLLRRINKNTTFPPPPDAISLPYVTCAVKILEDMSRFLVLLSSIWLY